jgi:hypothetical protein
MPPLGYRAKDHKLIVVDSEAETVRHIFRRYAALGSVRLLQQELEADGIRSKFWTSTAGRCWGGKPIVRGALYRILQNRIYRGEIVHKDQSYLGEHTPIVDEALWGEVQAKLAANAVEHRNGENMKNASLLAGLLFDGQGYRMTPTHAIKRGTRYRYYISNFQSVARVIAIEVEGRDDDRGVDADRIHRRHHLLAARRCRAVQLADPGPARMVALVGVHLDVDYRHRGSFPLSL